MRTTQEIWDTWKHKPAGAPSPISMRDACLSNARTDAKEEADAKSRIESAQRQLDGCTVGSETQTQALKTIRDWEIRLTKARSGRKHWQGMARWFEETFAIRPGATEVRGPQVPLYEPQRISRDDAGDNTAEAQAAWWDR